MVHTDKEARFSTEDMKSLSGCQKKSGKTKQEEIEYRTWPHTQHRKPDT